MTHDPWAVLKTGRRRILSPAMRHYCLVLIVPVAMALLFLALWAISYIPR